MPRKYKATKNHQELLLAIRHTLDMGQSGRIKAVWISLPLKRQMAMYLMEA
jgi:hypothetical protein